MNIGSATKDTTNSNGRREAHTNAYLIPTVSNKLCIPNGNSETYTHAKYFMTLKRTCIYKIS